MTYILTKLSSPGFTLETEHISVIENILQNEVCAMCKVHDENICDYEQEGLTVNSNFYEGLLLNREKLYIKDEKNKVKILPKENEEKLDTINGLIVESLLNTSCGAEYWLEIKRDDMTADEAKEEYFKQQKEDIEEYQKIVKRRNLT